MAVKNKISKVKRNNQKRNKLIKQGVIKKRKQRETKHVSEPFNVPKPANIDESEESDHGEDMLQMVEEDDLAFLKNAITNRSYSLFNKVRYTGEKNKKRKLSEDDETLEKEYEQQPTQAVKLKNLLPIKTKDGIICRTQETSDNEEEDDEYVKETTDEALDSNDSGNEETFDLEEDDVFDVSKPITAAQLLATRSETLQAKRIQIGHLSAGVLENPEEKVNNINNLIKMLDDNTAEVYLTVRKLVIVSLLEVFKDLLPSYQIKQQESSTVKLKKDTFRLQKFEMALLQFYKKYLQKLEKFCQILIKKRGDSRVRSAEEKKLGELAVNAMCDLLIAHPYFNYSQNIAQAIVPFLNHRQQPIRLKVNLTCKTVFKEDKKGEITLKILRIINQYLKKHAHNVNTEMLEVLLALRIKEVNLDQEKENEMKQKKLMSHKQRVMQLSKKERKRKKHLEELEKELLETKAEENKKTKQHNVTEIIKVVFGIYFRILKSSTNTRVLGVCLEGLAKFAHCINLEFYVDLVNVLDNLLKADWLGYRERLHCVKTVFTILSGQGEVINLDPTRFYSALYQDLLTTFATKNHKDFVIVLETLTNALIKRRKKITNKRMFGFVKRIATVSLQLLHNGTIGCLGLIKVIMQLSKAVDVLLDLDSSTGDGKYQAELDDPEYCNAASTALYELIPLLHHYHPIVCKYVRHIAVGVPSTGEGSLPPELGKCSPEQLFTDYDMTTMCFNPSIPVPKKAQPKSKTKRFKFADDDFKRICYDTVKNCASNYNGFYIEC